MLEEAIDPLTGSREKWSAFKDEGGLNKTSNLYGMSIGELSVSWDKGKFKSALMNVAKSTSPKEMRESLNKACGTTEQDWKKEDQGGVTKGEATIGHVKCSYFTNESASYYNVSINAE